MVSSPYGVGFPFVLLDSNCSWMPAPVPVACAGLSKRSRIDSTFEAYTPQHMAQRRSMLTRMHSDYGHCLHKARLGRVRISGILQHHTMKRLHDVRHDGNMKRCEQTESQTEPSVGGVIQVMLSLPMLLHAT
jgi:hypothetical protein